MADGKIHIKVGNLEVGYEGSEEFIKNDLLGTLEKVKDMFGITELPPQQPLIPPSGGKPVKGTVATTAAKLGVKNGPQLIMVTATHLTVVDNCGTFTRKQLLTNMKTASGYYKESYSANMTQYLNQLVKKQKLNEVSKDAYSLPIGIRKEMESKLASQ